MILNQVVTKTKSEIDSLVLAILFTELGQEQSERTHFHLVNHGKSVGVCPHHIAQTDRSVNEDRIEYKLINRVFVNDKLNSLAVLRVLWLNKFTFNFFEQCFFALHMFCLLSWRGISATGPIFNVHAELKVFLGNFKSLGEGTQMANQKHRKQTLHWQVY